MSAASDGSSGNGDFLTSLSRSGTLREGSLLSDRVYSIIRKSVINGELAPGQQVVESEIARLLAVSQAPVRDAVKRLAHEGLLTHIPRRGHFVTEVSEEDERQAREVRVPLEELAGRLAAQNAGKEELEELKEIVTALRSAAVSNDVATFRDLDIAFHTRVCEAGHNAFLTRLWNVMEPSWRALRAVADPLFDGDWVAMAEEHGRLLELLCARDTKKAAVAFARHANRMSPVPDHRPPRA